MQRGNLTDLGPVSSPEGCGANRQMHLRVAGMGPRLSHKRCACSAVAFLAICLSTVSSFSLNRLHPYRKLGATSDTPTTRSHQVLPEIKCQPLAPWTCLRATESGDDDDFKGKQRRALRSLAGRKKAEKSLCTLQQADPEPSDVWVNELVVALKAHELVNVRAHCAPTKKETKRVAELVSSRIQAELVQVIGHTYLLYKPGNPPKIDLAALTAPQPPSQDKKKKE